MKLLTWLRTNPDASHTVAMSGNPCKSTPKRESLLSLDWRFIKPGANKTP